eukprot:gene14274-20248_t
MSEEIVHVVEVDTTGHPSADIRYYKATKVKRQWLEDNIVEHKRTVCYEPPVAALCGLNMKMYFRKHSPGLKSLVQEGRLQAMDMSRNNGAATYLTIDLDMGLSEYVVEGRAYFVLDDGDSPLTVGQVWGIQEMVNCAMDIYNMDPANMRRGKQTLLKWSEQYKTRTWKPPSGTGGVKIYG